jgi:hypothetical protein
VYGSEALGYTVSGNYQEISIDASQARMGRGLEIFQEKRWETRNWARKVGAHAMRQALPRHSPRTIV